MPGYLPIWWLQSSKREKDRKEKNKWVKYTDAR